MSGTGVTSGAVCLGGCIEKGFVEALGFGAVDQGAATALYEADAALGDQFVKRTAWQGAGLAEAGNREEHGMVAVRCDGCAVRDGFEAHWWMWIIMMFSGPTVAVRRE